MTAERSVSINAHDGHVFNGFLAVPASGGGPGFVVVQEIFGITDYIKDVCRRLADRGYVALAPELFSRLERGLAFDERVDGSLDRALATMQRLDVPQAVDDTIAALETLRDLPEVVDRRAGVIGFCLGGGIAYFAASASDPDIAVCYYGSAIPGALDRATQITCPVIFHFGESDGYITAEQRAAVQSAFAGRPHTEFHLYPDANHAFDNHNAAMFHNAAAAERAWATTLDFVSREFPVSS
jgi:carboxymethylenebutenolidase